MKTGRFGIHTVGVDLRLGRVFGQRRGALLLEPVGDTHWRLF